MGPGIPEETPVGGIHAPERVDAAHPGDGFPDGPVSQEIRHFVEAALHEDMVGDVPYPAAVAQIGIQFLPFGDAGFFERCGEPFRIRRTFHIGAVGEPVPGDGIQRPDLQVVLPPPARRREEIVQNVWQGEQRRAGVEAPGGGPGFQYQLSGLAADPVQTIEDADLPSRGGQPDRRRQSAQAGADDSRSSAHGPSPGTGRP